MPPGITLCPKLADSLEQNGVPHEVVTALRTAMANAGVDPYSMSYAHGMDRAYAEYGISGVKHQVAYMLINLGRWQGAEAREAKKTLRKWSHKD